VTSFKLIVIGASWGGLNAVAAVLSGLPGDFPVPVLVVQHRAEDAGPQLAELLDRAGALTVREVQDKDRLTAGCVLVAPPGYHVLVEADHLALSTEAHVRFSRPSIDVALESAADALGPGALGVVLTGSNEDGAAGLARICRRGGTAIVQNPATAERPAMPAAAREAAQVQTVTELADIAPLLLRLARPSEVVG